MAQDQDAHQAMTTSSGSAHGSGMGLTSPSDAEYLRRQIADTRAGMTETIDAIQDRVSPRNIINRTRATIKDSTMARMRSVAHTMGTSAVYALARSEKARSRMLRLIRVNPAASAAVSVATLYFAVRALRGSRRRRQDYLKEKAL